MSAATQVATLRPGVALGDYPEQDLDTGSDERAAGERLASRRPRALSRRALTHFVARVHVHANTLGDLPAAQLGSHIDTLRATLIADGITDLTIARSFALVRETSARELGLRHYDTQLMAGRVMLEGALAQVQTGEGKTLAATLPASTAALAGIPVHVITANDYLAARDAAAMGPVYRALGLSVGAVTADTPVERRRAAYRRDVVYTTSKQLAFDYLRDRLVLGERRGGAHLKVEHLFSPLPRTERVTLRGLCFAIVDEADSVLIDEAGTPFVIARDVDPGDTEKRCRAALEVARDFEPRRDVRLDEARRRARLTDSGRERVASCGAALPGGRHQREALIEQALGALHLYRRDRDYLLRDDKIQIIDPHTGRVLADRSWEGGLHQMIECIEGCAVTAPRETLASLTFQRLFPRYLRLAGMTGTARDVAAEMWANYRLPVVDIPTHKPCRRNTYPLHVAACPDTKLDAIVAAIASEHARRRPVLVGTRTVEDSEVLSARLQAAGLEHQVLNARQDAQEAAIVARAGEAGRITVATNMAGRGTDISLASGVDELGGLHVIVSEPNDARRLDRQLYGRCARQGEPGSWQRFVCAQDTLIAHYSAWPGRLILRNAGGRGIASRIMFSAVIALAQRRCELDQRATRASLRKMQDYFDKLLAFTADRT